MAPTPTTNLSTTTAAGSGQDSSAITISPGFKAPGASRSKAHPSTRSTSRTTSSPPPLPLPVPATAHQQISKAYTISSIPSTASWNGPARQPKPASPSLPRLPSARSWQRPEASPSPARELLKSESRQQKRGSVGQAPVSGERSLLAETGHSVGSPSPLPFYICKDTKFLGRKQDMKRIGSL